MGKPIDARGWVLAAIFGACCCALCLNVLAEDITGPTVGSSLDSGFTGLYNLNFGGAQEDFSAWQRMHPDDPMGPASEAAGFLFSEFNRSGGP